MADGSPTMASQRCSNARTSPSTGPSPLTRMPPHSSPGSGVGSKVCRCRRWRRDDGVGPDQPGGPTSGIGEAVVRRFAACGAAVVVNSARSAAGGRSNAEELPDTLYVGGDIADPGTADALLGAVSDRWGRLDGLVKNAAMTTEVPLHDIDAVTPRSGMRPFGQRDRDLPRLSGRVAPVERIR